MNRFQFADTFSIIKGGHNIRFGGEAQRIDSDFDLGVFQQGRIELVEDFADFDHNGDGHVDDNDLLFAVTLRSATPDRALAIEVRAGNVFFLDPNTGRFPPFAPNITNPFAGFILPGAGATTRGSTTASTRSTCALRNRSGSASGSGSTPLSRCSISST